MSIVSIKDSKIPNIYSTGLYTEKGFDLSWEVTDKILEIMVLGTTECLKQTKSKDTPVAFVFKQPNDEFVAAAVVEFFPNEDDPGKPGNWNYSWTFDETDIPENAKCISAYDPQISSYFRAIGHTKYGMIFEGEYHGELFVYLLSVIKNWLDNNASDNEEKGVSLDGVIQFRVNVEKGEKIFSAEPDGEIKQLIKDDASIEV